MNEKELVRKILKGEKKAINFLYSHYKKDLLHFISQKVADKKDAEEILQDTFISALDSLPLFQYKSSLMTWLKSIAKHEVVDFYRRKKIKTILFSHFPILEKIIDQALGPDLAMQEKELKIKVWLTLKNLSEGYRKILRLKYIEGLSMAEIAKELKITVKAVESRLFRARLAFQKAFAEDKTINQKDWQILLTTLDQRELPF